jgi:hypothetical protein
MSLAQPGYAHTLTGAAAAHKGFYSNGR